MILEGRVLLVKRGKEPLRGRWVIPGGTVELGETLEEAVVREILEETSLRVRPLEMLTVFDRIETDEGRVLYHYVIVDYLCEYLEGSPRAASDAEAVVLARPEELGDYEVPDKALEVVGEGFRRLGLLRNSPLRARIKH